MQIIRVPIDHFSFSLARHKNTTLTVGPKVSRQQFYTKPVRVVPMPGLQTARHHGNHGNCRMSHGLVAGTLQLCFVPNFRCAAQVLW